MNNFEQFNSYIELREAIKKRDKLKAQNLILNNARVNNINSRGDTPLHWAITQFRDLKIIKMLLSRGANVHARNHKRRKPLDIAIQHNKTKAAILLIKRGALVGEDLNAFLLKAIQKNDYTLFKSLIANRAQYNGIMNFDSLFEFAIVRGNSQIIEEIIPHCPFVQLSKKYIPRDLVIKSQYNNCVNLLLRRNFTISPDSNRDEDFIYGAVENSHLSIVVDLLKLGIDVNMVSSTTKLTLLQAACLNKHYEIVKVLLQHNACVNVTTPTDTKILSLKCYNILNYDHFLSSVLEKEDLQNITCLHIAVFNCDPMMTNLLLTHGAMITNDPNFFNITCIAVQINCEEIVRIFLEHGVNVTDINSQGQSLLHFCVIPSGEQDTRYDIAKLLLEKGATVHIQTPRNTLIFDAVSNRHHKIAQLFLDYNADVQYISPNGDTLLHKAVEKDTDVEFVEALLKLNLPVDAVNNQLLTPLLVACMSQLSNQFEIIETLLRYNANVNYAINETNNDCTGYIDNMPLHLSFIFNHKGRTALHFICKYNTDIDARIIQLLLKYNANIEAGDARGWTPLFEACRSRNHAAVQCLLDHNANANHTNAENLTPLYIAAQYYGYYSKSKIVKMLLERKVNVHCVDRRGKSIIHIIVRNHNESLIKHLAQTQINFNSIDNKGNTPLHYVVQRERIEMTRHLIKYGANVNILNKKKRTPLWYAIKSMSDLQAKYEKRQDFHDSSESDSDDVSWDSEDFEDEMDLCKLMTEILKKQVVKLKTAGLKVNKQNLKLVYNSDDGNIDNDYRDKDEDDDKFNVLQFEIECEQEIEKMRIESVGVNNMTFYDLLRKNISSLSRFVKNKKIKQTLELEVYDEKFPLYMDIVRSRFRDAKLRYRFTYSAKEYFSLNICQRLSDDCIETVFSYLNIKDIRMFIRAMKPVINNYA